MPAPAAAAAGAVLVQAAAGPGAGRRFPWGAGSEAAAWSGELSVFASGAPRRPALPAPPPAAGIPRPAHVCRSGPRPLPRPRPIVRARRPAGISEPGGLVNVAPPVAPTGAPARSSSRGGLPSAPGGPRAGLLPGRGAGRHSAAGPSTSGPWREGCGLRESGARPVRGRVGLGGPGGGGAGAGSSVGAGRLRPWGPVSVGASSGAR